MTEPWAQSYASLSRPGRSVLRGLAALGARAFETRDIAPLGDLDQREVASTLAELTQGGWVARSGPDRWSVPDEPAQLIASLAETLSSPTAKAHVHKFTRYLVAMLQTAENLRLDEHRGMTIVAAVDSAGRLNLVDEALTLATWTWRASIPTTDQAWWHTLAHVSEEIAIEARDADRLVDLLQERGTAYARAGATRKADQQWRRAFVLTDAQGDRRRSAELLLMIGNQRRANGLFGQALTIFHELIRLYDDTDDRLGLATALTEMAVTLLRSDRPDDAEHFLRRAADTLPQMGDGPGDRRHAKALMTIGKLWGDDLASPATAVPIYSRSLAMLVDIDDEAAEEVRTLLAAAAAARSNT